MGDVLDIENSEEFEVDDESEQGIARLKEKARKRKGRGFGTRDTVSAGVGGRYESLPRGDTAAGQIGPQRSVEGWILFVSGVHEEAQEEDIQDKFSEYGDIKNIHLNLDRRTGFLKGYALVEFETYKQALTAIEALHTTDILGQPIAVNWCFTKAPVGKSHSRRRR